VKNCVGITELLSAYADGELTEANKQIVEDHLVICENCSAILKVYKEISGAINESNVPAPDALRIGVMNVIQSESIPRATDDNEQRKRYRFILTRYAPIAACLVVMLLVWQFWGSTWGNTWGISNNSALPENQMSMFASTDSIPDSALMPAPAAAPPPAAEEAGEQGIMRADTEMADQADVFSMDDGELGGEPRSEQEITMFMEYLNNAYAEIKVTGEFPALLAQYEPLHFSPWYDWELVFEIPSEEVPALLASLDGREGVDEVHINSDSTYAIVFFSYGE